MTLAELQAMFYRAVVGDDPVTALALTTCCTGSAERPADARLGVYANMYQARLVEAMRADFPKLAQMLGETEFARLAAAYVRMHPSENYDIGRLGRLFATFLRAHPGTTSREDAPDLAALEWARAEVFVESDDVPLDSTAWIALLSSDPSVTPVSTIRALRVLRLAHDVMPVFRALEEGSGTTLSIADPTTLVVWRAHTGHQVFHARVSEQEARALELASAGATMAEICGPFADAHDPVHAAFATLSSWVDEGLIVDYHHQAPLTVA